MSAGVIPLTVGDEVGGNDVVHRREIAPREDVLEPALYYARALQRPSHTRILPGASDVEHLREVRHTDRLATIPATISFAPSGPRTRSRMGSSPGSKISSKAKNGQHPRSKTMNSVSLVAHSPFPGKRNS